jgi:hypothetical protein
MGWLENQGLVKQGFTERGKEGWQVQQRYETKMKRQTKESNEDRKLPKKEKAKKDKKNSIV